MIGKVKGLKSEALKRKRAKEAIKGSGYGVPVSGGEIFERHKK